MSAKESDLKIQAKVILDAISFTPFTEPPYNVQILTEQ